jgi:ribonuclease G
MRNEIFVNVGPRETRVAVRESDQVVELHIERSNERGVTGGIYKGRVTRVLPGMQAAFVDIGLERAGFLYVADYRSDLSDVDLDDEDGNGPSERRGGGRRHASAAQRGLTPQIQDLLTEGNEILVQVAKEPLGTKGARITSRISLAGRHLVLMPSVSRVGVSRRIESDRERRRLRSIVEKHRTNKELGFIVRTVSHGVSDADIKADINYLTDLWTGIQKRCDEIREVPALIHQEPPLHLRILRDLTTHETKQIIVDDPDAFGEMQDFVQHFMAAPRPKIVQYKGEKALFDNHRIEAEIEEALGIKVWLKSGGYLVINQSEALTAIDVNTGRFTGGKSRNLEETILKTNLEAVREIVHQVRLRNMGGLIILDLIDMELAANREKVYRSLLDALREDKAKVNLLKISELGLIEMTRKRSRENLIQALGEPCPDCEGRGYIQSSRTICHKIFRELPKAAKYLSSESLLLKAHPDVTSRLENQESEPLHKTEEKMGRKVLIRAEPGFHREQFEILSGP